MRAISAIWIAAVREAWAKPRALVLDVTFMILNDLTWIFFWSVFFDRVGEVRGWDTSRFIELFAVITVVFGISHGLFANARRLSRLIANGELDAALTLPIDALAYLTVRRIEAAAFGDLIFGIGVFFIACEPTPLRTLTFMTACLLGSLTLTSFMILLGSLTLHFGGRGEQQDIGFEAITMFGFYPMDMFGGPTKVLLFSVIPAAFVTALPAGLLNDFELQHLLWLTGASFFTAALARWSFTAGLRKYRSGSRWTSA